jgi:hypothetical protein
MTTVAVRFTSAEPFLPGFTAPLERVFIGLPTTDAEDEIS